MSRSRLRPSSIPPLMGEPEEHAPAPPEIETEADVVEQPTVPWDPDEDGRDVG